MAAFSSCELPMFAQNLRHGRIGHTDIQSSYAWIHDVSPHSALGRSFHRAHRESHYSAVCSEPASFLSFQTTLSFSGLGSWNSPVPRSFWSINVRSSSSLSGSRHPSWRVTVSCCCLQSASRCRTLSAMKHSTPSTILHDFPIGWDWRQISEIKLFTTRSNTARFRHRQMTFQNVCAFAALKSFNAANALSARHSWACQCQ